MVSEPLVDKSGGILKGNKDLGFDGTFRQPNEHVGCPRISPK